MKLFLLTILVVFGLAAPILAPAGVDQISEAEFKQLAEELAPKVNLFAESWATDPKAEFYGGTTRDYLYWLKGQFLGVTNPADAKKTIEKLKALPIIDVREFIIGDSDVDIISAEKGKLDPKQFGVRKIDFQSTDILDPTTELGKNEVLQGYIPAEKIRLSKSGFHATGLGDGIKEIYSGKLSVHFSSPEDFAKSKYALEGINHPILLSLRYLRLQAINYYRTHGKGFPDSQKLLVGLDAESAKKVQEIINRAASTGELKALLRQDKFRSWLNGSIQKAFRSYTNPTAALELMKKFGATELPVQYPNEVEPLNQYIFAKHRDEEAIREALKAANVTESTFYSPAEKYFPDGKLYHGTKTEEAFRGILFQGVLPSEVGLAQGGLYGVALADRSFSENWGKSKDRLLAFELEPGAKIVDITQGEGLRVWLAFGGKDYDAFAEKYGIDIIRYPYQPQAFVVKNSSALGPAQGVHRTVMSVPALIEAARKINAPKDLLNLISVNSLTRMEENLVWKNSGISVSTLENFFRAGDPKNYEPQMSLPYIQDLPGIRKLIEEDLIRERTWAVNALMLRREISPEFITWLDSIFAKHSIAENYAENLYPILTKAGMPTPGATARVLTLLQTSGRSRLEKNQGPLLANATLSEKESAELFGYFQKIMPEFDSHHNTNVMVHALLRNGFHKAEAGELLFHHLEKKYGISAPVQGVSSQFPLDREFIHALIDHFPGDPRIDRIVYEFLRHNHGRLPEAVAEFVTKLPNSAHLKKYNFDMLQEQGIKFQEDYANALIRMNLSEQEKKLFLEVVDFSQMNNDQVRNFVLPLVDSSREFSESFLRMFVGNQRLGSVSEEYIKLARKLISNSPYRTEMENLLGEIMRDQSLTRNGEKRALTIDQISTILGIATDPSFDASDDLMEAIFRHAETYPPNYEPYWALKLFENQGVENPAVALRFQKYLGNHPLPAGSWKISGDEMWKLVSKMKLMTPEFAKALEAYTDSSRISNQGAFLDWLDENEPNPGCESAYAGFKQ